MWGPAAIVLLAAVSAVSPARRDISHQLPFSNLQERLNDPSWNNKRSALVGVGAETSTCSSIYSCLDCKTAQVCRPTVKGTFENVRNITCPASAPYCQYSTGTCTTQPDPTCGSTDDFICLADGKFPDANCSLYHVCENLTPHKFECIISGETYNADEQICSLSQGCSAFKCDGTGKKVANDFFPSYYGYCSADLALPVVIDRCVGINQLNTTSQLCEPICTTEGVLQDVEDCTKYYKCSYLWIDDVTKYLIRERMDCPTNTGFEPSAFMCVNLTQVPNCAPGVSVKQLHQLNPYF